MRAVVLHGVNDLRIEDVEVAPPVEGQVLVSVRASGICQTQLLEYRGRKGLDRFLPHLLGHEGSGVVEAVGPGVSKVHPGDRVFLSWIKGSGMNVSGGTYRTTAGSVNAGPIVTFAEQVVVSENRVTPYVANLSFEDACVISCAVATGAGAVINTARLVAGQTIMVFGLGGVGCAAIQAARHLGASQIIAADVAPQKFEIARRLGATNTIDVRGQDPYDHIMVMTNGRGVDVALDASGNPAAMEAAHRVVRSGGGLAIIAGNLFSGVTIAINPFSLIEGRRLVGTWGGETDPDCDFPRYAALAEQGALTPGTLISHRIRLDDIAATMESIERGEVIRAVILISSLS